MRNDIKKAQQGRSVLEMIAVVTLVLLLSVACVWGVRWCILHWKASRTIYAVRQRAVIAKAILVNNPTFSLSEFPKQSPDHYTITPGTPKSSAKTNTEGVPFVLSDYKGNTPEVFAIDVHDVPGDVCLHLMDMSDQYYIWDVQNMENKAFLKIHLNQGEKKKKAIKELCSDCYTAQGTLACYHGQGKDTIKTLRYYFALGKGSGGRSWGDDDDDGPHGVACLRDEDCTQASGEQCCGGICVNTGAYLDMECCGDAAMGQKFNINNMDCCLKDGKAQLSYQRNRASEGDITAGHCCGDADEHLYDDPVIYGKILGSGQVCCTDYVYDGRVCAQYCSNSFRWATRGSGVGTATSAGGCLWVYRQEQRETDCSFEYQQDDNASADCSFTYTQDENGNITFAEKKPCGTNQYCYLAYTDTMCTAALTAESTGKMFGVCNDFEAKNTTCNVNMTFLEKKKCPEGMYCLLSHSDMMCTVSLTAEYKGKMFGICNEFEVKDNTCPAMQITFNPVIDCPEDEYCDLRWKNKQCSNVTAEYTGLIYGGCKAYEEKVSGCIYK